MKDELEVFCEGIADAIRTKKGTSDTINAQKFAEEILSIEGGGSGDGAVIEYGGVGKVVPNTGTVEKVYLNTNLSEEEVSSLLNSLTYPEGFPVYAVVASENKGIMIMNSGGKLAILNEMFQPYWVNEAGAGEGGTAGWQEFTNPIEINEEVLSESGAGEQNNLLTSLFSITPFEKLTRTLTGTYDGSSIEVTENGKVDISGLIDEQKIPLSIDVNLELGVIINGLIKEYQVYAGETINAGDFVEFINGRLNSPDLDCHSNTTCILLEENKIFIPFVWGMSRSDRYLYGTIVTINGLSMSYTSTQLNSTRNICYTLSNCILLEDNKVFVAHDATEYSTLYGTIITIDGTAMTATTTQLNSDEYSSVSTPSCCLLEANKVFIAHNYSSNKYLYGTIVEINGTAMTATSTQLNSTSDSCCHDTSCCLVDTNKVFIVHSYSTSDYIYGTIVTIDGTTMTAVSKDIGNGSWYCGFSPSCCLLEANKVFIAHLHRSNGYYLWGTIITISGTTMRRVTKQLSDELVVNAGANCTLFDTNKLFITYGVDHSRYYLYGTIVEINGTTMTPTTIPIRTIQNSTFYRPSAIVLEPNKIFIAHIYSNVYNNRKLATSIYIGDYVKQNTNSIFDSILGVAKTSGTEGETIEVIVPSYVK